MINKVFLNNTINIGIIDNINTKRPIKETIRINNMIKYITHDMINDLIKPQIINQNTLLLLISATCFHYKWKYPFDPTRTQMKIFHSFIQKKSAYDATR